MDAVEFLKNRSMFCDAQSDCKTCHIDAECRKYFVDRNLSANVVEKMVSTVEQWAKDHPAKTRQSEFLKMFPNAYIAPGNDTICISPCNLDLSLQGRDECKEYNCAECRKNYWLQEVE